MKTFILDLDGTMYQGTRIIPEAKALIDWLHEHHVPYLFLTNNAMRTPQENTRYMLEMGFEHIEPWMFYNSAMAAAEYVSQMAEIKTAAYIGTPALEKALKDQGFEITLDNPAYVFVGLSRDQDYFSYSNVVPALMHGAKLIATNTDRVLVKADGFELGNGSIVAMFEYCSSQKALAIGKPHSIILDLCLEHYHLNKADVVLVGDNLETDIALGYNNHVETIFVQSGVHTVGDLAVIPVKPDHIYQSLAEFVLEDFL